MNIGASGRTGLHFLHLRPDAPLPVRALPGKVVLVIEAAVSQTWQWEASRWLVSSGCRYLLAWGKDCSSWDDSVDEANLERFYHADIPEDQFVITTWHEKEELEEVFRFAKHGTRHPVHDLREVLVLQISDYPRQEELEALYANT